MSGGPTNLPPRLAGQQRGGTDNNQWSSDQQGDEDKTGDRFGERGGRGGGRGAGRGRGGGRGFGGRGGPRGGANNTGETTGFGGGGGGNFGQQQDPEFRGGFGQDKSDKTTMGHFGETEQEQQLTGSGQGGFGNREGTVFFSLFFFVFDFSSLIPSFFEGGGFRGRGGAGGGFGRGRGRGEFRGRGRGGERPGQRQFERKSGSDKSGVKPQNVKEGHGKGNWGTTNDEFAGETEPLNTTTGSDTDNNAPAAERNPDEEPTGEEEEEVEKIETEPENTELTLEEWKAKQVSTVRNDES